MLGGGNCTELPLYLYESVIDMVAGEARILFVKLPYTLATEDSERIGVYCVSCVNVIVFCNSFFDWILDWLVGSFVD